MYKNFFMDIILMKIAFDKDIVMALVKEKGFQKTAKYLSCTVAAFVNQDHIISHPILLKRNHNPPISIFSKKWPNFNEHPF